MEVPSPAAHYEQRRAELGRAANDLDARERRMSALRGIAFLAAIAMGIAAGFKGGVLLWALTAALVVLFAAAVIFHAVLITKKVEIEQRLSLVSRAEARLKDAFENFAEKGDSFRPEQHPYSGDLDIFGHRSLFQLLVTAETHAGQSTLAQWLLAPASEKTVLERQAAVRELAERPQFREDLAVLAKLARAKMAPDSLFAWGEAKPVFEEGPNPLAGWLLSLRFFAPLTITLAVLAWTVPWDLPALKYAWMAALTAQLLVVLRTGERTERALAQASSREEPLGRYAPVFLRIETERFESPLLRKCQSVLTANPAAGSESGKNTNSQYSGRDSASIAMGRLQTILSFADLRHGGIFHLIFHLVTLWDIWCAVSLEKWRAQHGKRIRGWVEALATVEALSSLAAFAHEHPNYVYPEVNDGPCHLDARDLGHPLLPAARRVTSSVAFGKLDDLPQALLITGSNMSGKSTLLRSMGINSVLALAGAPVCATRLTMSLLDVRTSMRITDSLEQGVSHFYAELTRLKEITHAADAGQNVLFLLDEVLHGTNSRERQIGAKAVIKHLLKQGTIGAVSSHDLGLGSLEEETSGKVKNVHFEEHVEDGKMAFDYKLKPGVVSTTNALRLMFQVGLPVSEE
ncbi:MAG: DNA mismatch repair protein MutS [Polyangiaceae bacterium]|nr:DNA mismatch repair protein MutS [Polyangiaceae bacterium]